MTQFAPSAQELRRRFTDFTLTIDKQQFLRSLEAHALIVHAGDADYRIGIQLNCGYYLDLVAADMSDGFRHSWGRLIPGASEVGQPGEVLKYCAWVRLFHTTLGITEPTTGIFLESEQPAALVAEALQQFRRLTKLPLVCQAKTGIDLGAHESPSRGIE